MGSDNNIVMTVVGIVAGLIVFLIAARLLFTFIANKLVMIVDWLSEKCASCGSDFKPVGRFMWAFFGIIVMKLFGMAEKYLTATPLEPLNDIISDFLVKVDGYRTPLSIVGMLMIFLPWVFVIVKTGPIKFWPVLGLHAAGLPVALIYDITGSVAGLLGGKIYHVEVVDEDEDAHDPEAEEMDRLMVALEVHKNDGATWKVVDADNIVVLFPDGRKYRYQAPYPGMYGRFLRVGATSGAVVQKHSPSYVVEAQRPRQDAEDREYVPRSRRPAVEEQPEEPEAGIREQRAAYSALPKTNERYFSIDIPNMISEAPPATTATPSKTAASVPAGSPPNPGRSNAAARNGNQSAAVNTNNGKSRKKKKSVQGPEANTEVKAGAGPRQG